MFTGLSFKACREELAPVSGLGCFMGDISRVLKRHGFNCRIVQKMPATCVLRVSVKGGQHFVIRHEGKTLDPAKGVYDAIPDKVTEILAVSKG
jgi:hypothetical protein